MAFSTGHQILGILGCAAAFGLTQAGCEPPPESEPEPGSAERTAESAEPIQPALACPNTLWVGRVPAGASCPEATSDGWDESALFPGATGMLGRFCRYEWTGAGAADVDALPHPPGSSEKGTVWLDRDCRVVAPMASPSPTETARTAGSPAMFETFLAALGMPTSVTLPTTAPTIRVAVIDSLPGGGEIGRSAHGFGMFSLIHDTACASTGSSCPLDLRAYLALDITAQGTVDRVHGGQFGYQSVVARQVFEATRDWVADGSPGHLVLNLSIAWDAAYNIDDEGQLAESAAAVREALSAARCVGALAFAAAGNESGGPVAATGAMYPAAWEQIALSCPGAVGEPPVYAVGGTDAVGGTLPNARVGARSRLVADGYVVPAQGQIGGTTERVGPYTGTSVATAAAVAAAALVWMKNDTYSASQVASHLHQTGLPTGLVPDVCPALGPCGLVRRLSFCGATGGQACRALPTANPAWGPSPYATLLAQTGQVVPDWSGTAPLTGTVCDGDVYFDSVAAAPSAIEACPAQLLPNETIVPWLSTQPGVPICGACSLSIFDPMAAILELGISEKLGQGMYPSVLTLQDENGRAVERYDLTAQTPAQGLLPGTVTRYRLPGMASSAFKFAVVEWLRGVDGQTQSDIPLATP